MKRTMIVQSGMVLAEMPRENSVLELFALNFDVCEDFRLCDFGKGLRFFFPLWSYPACACFVCLCSNR